jgi:preprotein translocase subunit YajC
MGTTAAAVAAASKSGSSSFTFILLIAIVFIGFYFLMIRPQRRRQQQAQQQQRTVSPGARVRTTAGMYATVTAVDGDDVILEVAPGVDVRYMKRAIMEVVAPGEADAGDTEVHPDGYADDDYATSDHSDTSEASEGAGSAEEGLTESHDGLADSKDGVAGSGNAF